MQSRYFCLSTRVICYDLDKILHIHLNMNIYYLQLYSNDMIFKKKISFSTHLSGIHFSEPLHSLVIIWHSFPGPTFCRSGHTVQSTTRAPKKPRALSERFIRCSLPLGRPWGTRHRGYAVGGLTFFWFHFGLALPFLGGRGKEVTASAMFEWSSYSFLWGSGHADQRWWTVKIWERVAVTAKTTGWSGGKVSYWWRVTFLGIRSFNKSHRLWCTG